MRPVECLRWSDATRRVPPLVGSVAPARSALSQRTGVSSSSKLCAVDIKNATVFVTGASAGFGAAITRRFAAVGARVVASARRVDRLVDLARELGPGVLPLELDGRDRGAVDRAVTGLPAPFAEVDVLVNNAGGALGLEPAQRAKLGEWEQMIDTNCAGLIYCTHAILPGMVTRGRGHVI